MRLWTGLLLVLLWLPVSKSLRGSCYGDSDRWNAKCQRVNEASGVVNPEVCCLSAGGVDWVAKCWRVKCKNSSAATSTSQTRACWEIVTASVSCWERVCEENSDTGEARCEGITYAGQFTLVGVGLVVGVVLCLGCCVFICVAAVACTARSERMSREEATDEDPKPAVGRRRTRQEVENSV